jgi:steroid 5-alpha reductase family enzyme
MKTIDAINLHKALVIPVVVALMIVYQNFSTPAFVYLALHGTYSVLWLIKEATYPDRRFQERVPVWVGLVFIFLPLGLYYIAPYILISRGVSPPPAVIGAAVSLTMLGVFLHYVSDAQKYYTLRYQKDLITDGLFSRTRNPNYLGEILIYCGFAVLAMHWLPFVILGGWVFGYFLRNMMQKDRSISRHPGWDDYRKHSGLLWPRILPRG